MRRLPSLLGCALLAAAPAMFAQSDFHRHNIVAGFGAAIPAGDSSSFLSTAPLVKLAYGYRFNRLFQADAGFEMAFGAADNNQNAVLTNAGVPVRGGDHEFMIPLGGRIIIPQPLHRIEVSAGGGAVYLHYSETAPAAGQLGQGVNCFSCTSRDGWGGYGLASVNYFLDDTQTFHVGTTFQYIAGATNGPAVGTVPGIQTTDHWANLTFEFGVSF